MTFQVDLTQKKNGTFLADARAVDDSPQAEQQHLQANPYRDAAAFRAVLKHARLESETEAALERASAVAESRPEDQVSCEVAGVEAAQLRKIGLN